MKYVCLVYLEGEKLHAVRTASVRPAVRVQKSDSWSRGGPRADRDGRDGTRPERALSVTDGPFAETKSSSRLLPDRART